MARYLLQATADPASKQSAPADLSAWISSVVGKIGGCLVSLDYAVGPADLVMVLDVPDEATMAALEELGSNAGKFKPLSRVPLIRPAEAQAVMRRIAAASAEIPAPIELPSPAVPVAMPRLEAAAPASVESIEPLMVPVVEPVSEPLELAAVEAPSEAPLAAEEIEPAGAGLPSPSMLATIGEMPPGAYELVAGRFTRFSELGAFSETIQALPGIRSVTIQQFLRGMVSMRIQYDNNIPLETWLKELRQFKPEVRAIGPAQLEMLIFAESRGMATEGAPATPAIPLARTVQAPAELAPLAAQPPQPALRGGGLLHPAGVREAATSSESPPPSLNPRRIVSGAAMLLAAGLVSAGVAASHLL